MKRLVFISWMLLPLPIVRADAEPLALPPVPWSDLVSDTIAHNPERLFYEAALKAARADATTAGRLAPPEIHGGAGSKRTRDFPTGLAGEGVAWSVGVSQTFEWPGRLSLRKAIANEDVTLAELGYQRFIQALGHRTRLLALQLAGGRARSEVAAQVAARLREVREMLVLRDPGGVTPALEIRILEATELTIRRKAAEAHLAEDGARVELNLLRGKSVSTALGVEATAPVIDELPPLDTLLAAAQTNNFDIRTRASELRQQGFRVELSKNERWPAFTLGPQFTEENSLSQDRQAGVVLSIPLPLWRTSASNVEAAKSRRIQAETVLATTRREVERRIVQAEHGWEIRTAELANWRTNSVDEFRAAAELADRHFRLGAVPAATYVELQRQYLEAVETLLNTRREALEHVLELEQLSGVDLTSTSFSRP